MLSLCLLFTLLLPFFPGLFVTSQILVPTGPQYHLVAKGTGDCTRFDGLYLYRPKWVDRRVSKLLAHRRRLQRRSLLTE
ncbi:hypothetical protein HYFRA_00008358 [Hymenoscyphus fraxineus]|uniref:Secreted protein n=1 Tax=Hymenoscyphus fraxineus TaxID=746836 RepID=A0A9N9PNZ0_9HELO|nr:hypothetical protein HYFRA_00008358 [Hymenoscyphus fraxineus]